MQAPWTYSSSFLPYTGEPIDFLLEDRNQPMHGTFADGMFHSRWADYDADCVQSWRGSDTDPSAEQLVMPSIGTDTTGMLVGMLKRLTKVLSWRRHAAPIAPQRTHSRINAQ